MPHPTDIFVYMFAMIRPKLNTVRFCCVWTLFCLALNSVNCEGQSTCDALTDLATQTRALSHFGLNSENCTTTDNCLGIQCRTNAAAPFYARFALLPCSSPVAVNVLISYDGSLLFDRNITHSQVLQLRVPFGSALVDIPANVTYIPAADSVTLGMQANVLGTQYVILPITTIPIDPDLCSTTSSTTAPPPTTDTPPPTTVAPPTSTCDSLDLIATEFPSRFELPSIVVVETCSRFENCSGVACLASFANTRYHLVTYLLQCRSPPAIHFLLTNTQGDVIIDRVVNQNATISFQQLGFTVSVDVTLTHPTRESIVLGIVAGVPIFNYQIVLLPPTLVPLDLSTCSNYACMQWAAISDGLDTLVRQHGLQGLRNDTCTSYANCSGVECALQVVNSEYNARLESVPCTSPPSVHLQARDGSGSVLIDRVFSKTEVVQLKVGVLTLPLTVSVVQVPGGLYVGMSLELLGTHTIVRRTLIPVDSSACLSNSSFDSSSSQQGLGQGGTVGLVVGVLMGVTCLAVTIVTISVGVVFVLVYTLRRKQTSVSLSGATVNFATKDFIDEANLDEIDDFPEGDLPADL